MTEREAYEAGYTYTGMTDAYYSKKWEETKARAQAIKKMYKGADYRIITSKDNNGYYTSTWKSIYGNDLFCKAQHFNPERELEYLDHEYSKRLEAILEEYTKAVEKETQQYEKRKATYDLLMSVKVK